MKRLFVLLLAVALLWGCTAPAVPETQPGPTETTPVTQPPETLPPDTATAETEMTQTKATDPPSYPIRLHAAVPIYEAPTYDAFCVRVVGEDGVYTIVEEASDAEGIRWGRLKSGAGWVDLEAADIYTPVTAAYADEALLAGGNYHNYNWETSEYVTKIVFRAREPLTDARLIALEPDWERGDGYTESRVLCALPALEPGMPLVAELAFPGDMTAYGISFTTESGEIHHYAVAVSGRNGSLVMTEYTP